MTRRTIFFRFLQAIGRRGWPGYAEFASRFPNMPARQSADLMVAVPSPATLGVSLWGCGDGVTILFACDLKANTVSASKVAT